MSRAIFDASEIPCITDARAIMYILDNVNRFVCFLGAGVSVEAKVKSAQKICRDIYRKLVKVDKPEDIREWKANTLLWNDASRRYSRCVQVAYPNPAGRVQYFRRILEGTRPSFSHHAIALLMTHGYFKKTCLTTNFDKLLESAFIQQGNLECQPIRTEEESKYYEAVDDRCYIVKLHGDYDTHNVLNTGEETIAITETEENMVKKLLQDSGLFVIGTAGIENSIHTLFNRLCGKPYEAEKVLNFGFLWGIYMNGPKPNASLKLPELRNLIKKRIDADGVVSGQIFELIKRMHSRNPLFSFFPVWGAGSFFFDLVNEIKNKIEFLREENRTHNSAVTQKIDNHLKLVRTAELYLDRDMRLRHRFTHAGLSRAAIDSHISLLDRERDTTKKPKSQSNLPDLHDPVYEAYSGSKRIKVRVVYGDITSLSDLEDPQFQSKCRAILSPDDTCISTGGGVAHALLEKAGEQIILNELAKFSATSGHGAVEQGSVIVTSGGNLPLHYILHAAATEITQDGRYLISKKDVHRTIKAALEKAKALEVEVLWIPLIGAGVASLLPKQSLSGILEAIASWKYSLKSDITLIIVIYKEGYLPRNEVFRCLRRELGSHFKLKQL